VTDGASSLTLARHAGRNRPPGSGFGASMLAATPYGTTLRSAPCSAHGGIGLLKCLPITPSNEATSPGWYNRPSRLSNDRFSNITDTT
jgi:hypothetical protein